MRKFAVLAVAALAASLLSADNALAQDVGSGYNHGVGLSYGFGSFPYPGVNNCNRSGFAFPGRIGFSQRQEAPPYFAQFPPVYYNGIVSRPYGISPYAAPSGITPVEMNHTAPTPVTIKNPHFDGEIVTPVSEAAEPVVDDTANKSTHIVNPYIETITALESPAIDTLIFEN